MLIHRLCLSGALLLLGACTTPPVRPAAKATLAVPSLAPMLASTPPVAVAPATVPSKPAPKAAAPAPVSASLPHAAVHHAAARIPIKKAVAAKPVTVAAIFQITGQVVLQGARGQQIEAGEQADTLVYFVPAAAGDHARPGRYTVYTHNRDFSPQAMAVPQGSTVSFVNLDDVRHNVFSVTPGAAFDLGYQGSGEKAAHVFARAGVVLISCNVHHSMELDLLVVPTSHVVRTSADGRFSLRDLPAGAGTLHFWNPRAQPLSLPVTLPMSDTVRQTLLATRPRMTTELNADARP
jgi:plastocyanin